MSRILSAQVCTFNNVTCGSFTALNQRGYLKVQVENTGYIAAAYSVQARRSPALYCCMHSAAGSSAVQQ